MIDRRRHRRRHRSGPVLTGRVPLRGLRVTGLAAALTAVLAAVLAAVLTACSGGSTPEPAGSGAGAGASTSPAALAWSPCDRLTATTVGRLLDEPVREETGTADQPRCTFLPRRDGAPAYDVSYLWFDGGLDVALAAMGAAGTQLHPVTVPGADAARLAVARRSSGLLVTGFVQTRGLVQSVNAVQIEPYDERAVVRGTRALLAELARRAPGPSAAPTAAASGSSSGPSAAG